MSNVVSINKNQPRHNKILTYIHCAMCCEEIPAGISMQDYAIEETGFTKEGLQVWCRRHNANIIHIGFEGRKLPSLEG